MSKNKRNLTADEKRLWRHVASGVKPRRPIVTEVEEAEQRDPKPPPVRVSSPSRHKTGPPKALPIPQNRRNEKRIRRGRLEVDATLDLHGHTQDSAREAVAQFLRAARRRGDRTVVVVTGAGRSGEGVLKRRLPEWLGERDIAALVSGYAPAHRSHGGAGAFYVFVKRRETSS